MAAEKVSAKLKVFDLDKRFEGRLPESSTANATAIQWANPNYTQVSQIQMSTSWETLHGHYITDIGEDWPRFIRTLDVYAQKGGPIFKRNVRVVKWLWANNFKAEAIAMNRYGLVTESVDQSRFMDILRQSLGGGATTFNTIHIPRYTSSAKGAAPLLEAIKGRGCVMSTMVSKTIPKGQDFHEVSYFGNRYFLAQLIKFNPAHEILSEAQKFIGSRLEWTNRIVPLMTLVTHNDCRKVLKMSEETNIGLDGSLFELWVDKSLEDAGSKHPFRTQYVRSVRNPLLKTGVKLVVKDNLEEEFRTMAPPKFKTLNGEKEWLAEMTEECLSKERQKYGVIKRKAKEVITEIEGITLQGDNFPF